LFYTIECEVADVYHVTAFGPGIQHYFFTLGKVRRYLVDTLVARHADVPADIAPLDLAAMACHGRLERLPQVLVYYRLFFLLSSSYSFSIRGSIW